MLCPNRIEVPGAVLADREERLARSRVEPDHAIARRTGMPRGGHFAALEAPELLVEDVRAFVAPLRESR